MARTNRVLEAVVGELALQVLHKLAADAVLEVVLFKLVALRVTAVAAAQRTRALVRDIGRSGRRSASPRYTCTYALHPYLQFRPIGDTLTMPLRNSMKVPLVGRTPVSSERGQTP